MGKACCGWLGQHLGVVRSVIVTEAATALFIVATLILPLGPVLILLPLLGVVLNGTSSVLYGTVPELARKGETSRAFALFYTGVIGAGGLAPIAYGAIADHSSRTIGVLAAALTAAAIIPMVLALGPFLPEARVERARPMTAANQTSSQSVSCGRERVGIASLAIVGAQMRGRVLPVLAIEAAMRTRLDRSPKDETRSPTCLWRGG